MAFLAGVLSATGAAVVLLAALGLTQRRRLRRHDDVFTCRVRARIRGGRRERPGRWGHWRLGRTQARWIHDVLVLRSGPFGLSSVPYAARVAEGATVRSLSRDQVRGLGRRPWALELSTEDGVSLELAVADIDRERLVGPYLTAAMAGLPPVSRKRRG